MADLFLNLNYFSFKFGVTNLIILIISLLGFPVAVKSIYSHDQKVFKVVNMEQLAEACQNFWSLSDVIIEPWITGDRYIVYIVEDQPLLPLYADTLVSEATKKEYYKVSYDYESEGVTNYSNESDEYILNRLMVICFMLIFLKSEEDIFIAISKIDRHFKASYFSLYKMKRLIKIEKICIKLNVPNY